MQLPPLPQSRGTRWPGPACKHPAPEPTTPHGPDVYGSGPAESTPLHSPLQVLGCGTGRGMVLGDTWADSDLPRADSDLLGADSALLGADSDLLGADSDLLRADSLAAASNRGAPPSVVVSRAYSRGQAYIFCLALDTHRHPHQALTDDLTDHSSCPFTKEETEVLGTSTPWARAISQLLGEGKSGKEAVGVSRLKGSSSPYSWQGERHDARNTTRAW